jgi:hypothetical protein
MKTTLLFAAMFLAFVVSRTEAYLGGFEPVHGYTIDQIPSSPP